jgi:signal transduction histidine kinase
MVGMIEQAAFRGADIIKQLLTFGRGVEGQRLLLQPRNLLKEMAKVIRETFPKSITLEQQFPETLWIIQADPTQIHQVLLNLCVNARDAIRGAGSIIITTANARPPECPEGARTDPGCWVMMSVADTGHGMDTGTLERVFEPFFTTKEEGRGSGLGLASVYGIVAQHRGVIEVESQPGVGTVFRVYLPCAEDHAVS